MAYFRHIGWYKKNIETRTNDRCLLTDKEAVVGTVIFAYRFQSCRKYLNLGAQDMEEQANSRDMYEYIHSGPAGFMGRAM